MIKHIKRFPSLNGAIHAESFSATLGIPQGDPLSMLAAAALLGQWTTQMPQDDLFNKVSVDDRLMLSNSDHALLDAFHATELWDERMGFTTKAKTCAFGSTAEVSNVWWMDATEVSRCKMVTYLGVPLPLYGISAFDFYNPIIQKALNTLNRICRAKLTNENATAIISRKILPALCYPATVVRPTKAQMSTLRSKIFAAAAQRPCQTMLAHTLFCEKTRQFDPESALIYHNLRFWRRVFLGDPKLRDEFLHWLEDALPCKPVPCGPINIFQKDIDWLGCIFNPSNAEILHPSLGTLSLYDPDKRGFEHKLRSFIRHTLASALQDKHVKWEGVADVDIGTTTALLRSLDPDCPIRVPLIRLLSDAHATQHRLHKMGVIAVPHCPHCLHEDADIAHIIWDCPRFSTLRSDWPIELLRRENWPTCSLNSLICTHKLPTGIKQKWTEFQKHVSKLLYQWMEFQRSPELYETFAVDACQKRNDAVMNLELREACSQSFIRSDAAPLPLEWKPPSTRTAINQWGATLQDYSCIFSFWTKTSTQDDDNLVRLTTWTQALAVFIQIGGNAAPFLSRCPNLTMAVFKFKVLSCKILKAQTELADLASMLDEEAETSKWLTVFPREAAFPQAIKILTSWDLSEAASNLHLLHLQLRTDLCIHAKAIKICTADFDQAIPKLSNCLRLDPLSGEWPTPKLPCKGSIPPWVAMVYEYRLRRHPAEGPVTCVMQISLDDWICLPIDALRNKKILGPPGMRKRFQAVKRRFCKFKEVLLNYWQMQLLGNSKRTHLAPPIWRDDDSCHCCGQLLQFSTRPRILFSNCVAHTDISSDLFQKWCSDFDAIDAKLQILLDSL